MNVTKELEAPLLARKRVTLEVQKRGVTPSRKVLVKEVANKIGAKPELVIIKHVYQQYGSQDVKIIAHIYKNRKDLEQIEEKYLVEKNTIKEPEPKKEKETSAAEKAPATEDKAEEPEAKEE